MYTTVQGTTSQDVLSKSTHPGAPFMSKPRQQNQSNFSFSREQLLKSDVPNFRSYGRNLGWFLIASALLLAIFLPLQSAFGDNVYARIRGIVTDPTGAAVANATVTALNTDT